MSTVSSVFSSRSSALGIPPQLATIMDSIFAIAFGLGVRFAVDLASRQSFKITGTLVGLWEGIVMLHFSKKMPRSYDPYIGYAVRLFIDFLVTESFPRLVLVLVWTGLGMVLADIAPVIWKDTGLKRAWHHIRRDLYVMTRSVPKVTLFPRARTVRFSPARTLSTSVRSTPTPSIITATTNTNYLQPPPSRPSTRKTRVVPGSFPGDVSETETDATSLFNATSPSAAPRPHASGTSHSRFRFSLFPQARSVDLAPTEMSSAVGDPDDGNISTTASSPSSSSTEIPDAPTPNPADIPEIEEEPAPQELPKQDTPRPNVPTFPPTPLESPRDLRSFPTHHEPDGVRPPPASEVPIIPDNDEGGVTDDWEHLSKRDAFSRTPTPPPLPPKDTTNVPPTIAEPPVVLQPRPIRPASRLTEITRRSQALSEKADSDWMYDAGAEGAAARKAQEKARVEAERARAEEAAEAAKRVEVERLARVRAEEEQKKVEEAERKEREKKARADALAERKAKLEADKKVKAEAEAKVKADAEALKATKAKEKADADALKAREKADADALKAQEARDEANRKAAVIEQAAQDAMKARAAEDARLSAAANDAAAQKAAQDAKAAEAAAAAEAARTQSAPTNAAAGGSGGNLLDLDAETAAGPPPYTSAYMGTRDLGGIDLLGGEMGEWAGEGGYTRQDQKATDERVEEEPDDVDVEEGDVEIPDSHRAALEKAVKLVLEGTEMRRYLPELLRQRDSAAEDGADGVALVREKEKEIRKLERGSARLDKQVERIVNAYPLKNPSNPLDLNAGSQDEMLASVEANIMHNLVPTSPTSELVVTLSMTARKATKVQPKLVDLLRDLSLVHTVNGKKYTIEIPR